MTRTSLRLLAWLPPLVWAAAIFTVSSFPSSRLPGRIPSELGHFGEYFILGVLLFFALRRDLPPARALASAILIASLFGVTDELHQAFVPTRTPDPADWGVDTLGALAGATCALFASGRLAARRNREKSGAVDS